MKKVTQSSMYCSLMLLLISVSSFTTKEAFLDQAVSTETSDNSCTVFVKTSYDSPAKNTKISTDVSGGISCMGGRNFYTNSEGKVKLQWVSGCYLKNIYVEGKAYKVNYKNGETYYLTIK